MTFLPALRLHEIAVIPIRQQPVHALQDQQSPGHRARRGARHRVDRHPELSALRIRLYPGRLVRGPAPVHLRPGGAAPRGRAGAGTGPARLDSPCDRGSVAALFRRVSRSSPSPLTVGPRDDGAERGTLLRLVQAAARPRAALADPRQAPDVRPARTRFRSARLPPPQPQPRGPAPSRVGPPDRPGRGGRVRRRPGGPGRIRHDDMVSPLQIRTPTGAAPSTSTYCRRTRPSVASPTSTASCGTISADRLPSPAWSGPVVQATYFSAEAAPGHLTPTGRRSLPLRRGLRA